MSKNKMTVYPKILIEKSDGLNFRVSDDCIVDACGVIISKGFETDLVSSMRLLWFIIPPHGKCANASIVHDFVWRNSIFERKKCDDIFLQLLIELEVPKWQCYLMYVAVRLFGWLKNNKIK